MTPPPYDPDKVNATELEHCADAYLEGWRDAAAKFGAVVDAARRAAEIWMQGGQGSGQMEAALIAQFDAVRALDGAQFPGPHLAPGTGVPMVEGAEDPAAGWLYVETDTTPPRPPYGSPERAGFDELDEIEAADADDGPEGEPTGVAEVDDIPGAH